MGVVPRKLPNKGPRPGLLGLRRLGSASLALPAPCNNSPAAEGGRATRSAAAVVAGAGKASEADARQGEPSKPGPRAYNPCASGTITFGNIFGNLHSEKNEIFGCFSERNPLPGSAPARHLEPDAVILMRFGSLRGRISHKSRFLKFWCHILAQNVPGPDCSW